MTLAVINSKLMSFILFSSQTIVQPSFHKRLAQGVYDDVSLVGGA
jgi:hypothetical protein